MSLSHVSTLKVALPEEAWQRTFWFRALRTGGQETFVVAKRSFSSCARLALTCRDGFSSAGNSMADGRSSGARQNGQPKVDV